MDSLTLSSEEILRHFGGAEVNMLENIVDSFRDESEVNIISHSPYYSIEKLPDQIKTGKSKFSVLSLNAQSLQSKFPSLEALVTILREQNIRFDTICIQETWLEEQSDLSQIQLDDYICYSQGRHSSKHGGLITYVDSRLTVSKPYDVPRSNIWEGLFLEIADEEANIRTVVGNIYKPPRNNNNAENIQTFINEITPLLEETNRRNANTLIVGDYNINLLKINEVAHFAEFFDKMSEFSFYPKITLPTRIGRSSTLIDNVFCKLSSSTLNTTAGILYSGMSDHFPYFLSLDNEMIRTKGREKFVKQKVNIPTAIPSLINDLLNSDIHNTLCHDIQTDPNDNYDKLIKHIMDLKSKHIPNKQVKYNKHKHKNNKWITYGIIKSISKRDNMHLQLKKTQSNSAEYLTLKNNLSTFNGILKKAIREAKVKYFEDIFEKSKYDIKNTWKNISEILRKSNKNRVTIDELIVYDRIVKDKQIIADSFNLFFTNIGPDLASNIDTRNKKPYSEYLKRVITSSFYFKLTNEVEVAKIIKSFKPKSSTGHDGISMKLLKLISPAINRSLALIINQSLITGIFPQNLKIAKVTPIYKKDEKHLMNNYRPVSLLTSISKVFEKVVFLQLYQYFNENKLSYKNQYGFREKHSTELATLELVDRVSTALDQKDTPIAVYMDLSKAFDTLDHRILLHKLKFYGIRGVHLNWFKSYLENRKQFTDIDTTHSITNEIKTGVPQGSILGPLLFLIYMNDIPNASSELDFILYADDSTLSNVIRTSLPHRPTKDEIALKLNVELAKVHDWLAVNRLSLNIKKTKFMIFHNINKDVNSFAPKLQINDIEIERVSNFNFLGTIVNENLSWKPHADHISNKISKYIGIMNKLKRFLPTRILRILYCSMIQSLLNYSLLVWGTNNNRIEKLQKKAIRTISNSKYNAHSEPLFKELRILKIRDLFNLNVLKFYYKFVKGNVPEYFKSFVINEQNEIHDYNTRFGYLISRNVTRTHKARHSLRNYISTVINNTNQDIIQKIHTHSYQGFSNYAKNTFLKYYSSECNIQNCYICSLS